MNRRAGIQYLATPTFSAFHWGRYKFIDMCPVITLASYNKLLYNIIHNLLSILYQPWVDYCACFSEKESNPLHK